MKILDTAIDNTPGKFEGEPEYVKYFYNIMMDGGGDETLYDEHDRPNEIFILDQEEREQLGFDVLVLFENEYGFVYHWLMNNDELDSFKLSLGYEV